MILDTTNHADKQRKYVQLTYEQKEKIYNKDRHRFSNKAIAKYYGIHEKSVKKIIDKFEENREIEKLSNKEVLAIVESKSSKEVVKKVADAKAELITVEAKYKTAQIETQNTLHEAIQEDIVRSRSVAQASTDIAMESLQKAIASLDHADPMAVASILASYEKLINAQQKHMNTLMNVANKYGIVDQTPKTPLIDQSTKSIHAHNHSGMVQYTPMMAIPEPLSNEEISKMNAIAGEIVE
jgi:DNA-binding MarR family transcriptional regulator